MLVCGQRYWPMVRETQILELVDRIYMAGFGECPWEHAMTMLRDITDATAVTIHVDSPYSEKSLVLANVGINPDDVPLYETYYVSKNPWMLRAAGKCRAGQVMFGEDFVDRRELLKTEYYDGFLDPNGVDKAQALCLHARSDIVALVAILRSGRQREHDADDLTFARRLMPHLQRASLAHLRFAQLESMKWLSENALDALASGAIVLDEHGKVAFMNSFARQMIEKRGVIEERDEGLHFVDRNARLKFHSVAISGEAEGAAFFTPKYDSPGFYEVLVIPFREYQGIKTTIECLETERGHLVLITDPDAAVPRLHLHLRYLYKMTPAEIRITHLLVDGRSLPEIAELRRTSYNTVKAQVRSIYQKVGVSTRSELTRRVTALQVSATLTT